MQLRKFSKGMLQRIGIAQALINEPRFVLLDEPMTGLDPVGRVEVKEIIQRLHERGTTVLFNSHILADVAALCTRIAIMREGRVVWQGAVDDALAADPRRRPRELLHGGGALVKRVAAVAVNTFRETIRDRILGVIILFALAMIVAGLWLASISLGQEDRMIKDFGLVAISLFGLIVAAFVAASLVRKEVEKRTVFIIFSKPVSRSEFIWGKFLGLASTMFTVLAGMTVFLFCLAWFVARSPSGSLLLAGLLIFLQLLVVMAMTMLFSTMTSAILASVWGICVYAAGQLSHNVLSLSRTGHSAVAHALSTVVFYLVPNLSAVDLRAAVAGEGSTSWPRLAAWCVYLIAYLVIALMAATWIFRRKEF